MEGILKQYKMGKVMSYTFKSDYTFEFYIHYLYYFTKHS